MPLPKSNQKYSYADYLSWNEDERWEIIDGLPYMKAAPSRVHQEILMELSKQLAVYLTGKSCKIYPAPFCVRLDNVKNDSDVKNVVEPDITVVCDSSKLDERGCNGSPDMIIEILSPSSVKKDRFIKFNTYEKAGVREYWIVEPDEKLVSVFVLQPDGNYGRPNMYTQNDKISLSIFSDLEINLESVFGKV